MNTNKSLLYRFTLAAATAALLALVLPIRGDAGEPLAIVADARGHVAFAGQHTSRFDGGALEIAARSDKASETGPTARFRLSEVRQGTTVFPADEVGEPEVRVSGRRISYLRSAGIVERYEILAAGVEQSFVLKRRWPGDGNLVITLLVDADQELGEPLPDGSGGFILPFEDGTARLRYGAATAIDAAGRRRGVAVAIVEGRITLTVDGGWLATAAYPVIVDPLISVENNTSYQGRPAAAFDFGGGSDAPRYLVAYESDNSGGPKQIWGKLIDWKGARVSIPSGDSSFDGALNISADSTVAHTKPTVAFKFGKVCIDCIYRNYLVAWERSDGALGYRILDKSGSPLRAPAKISSGGAKHDVTAAAGPQAGRPYFLAYRSVSSTMMGLTSVIRLARVDDKGGTLLADASVESLGPVDNPIYAPHIAYGHSASDDYYVLAYRRSNGQIVIRKVDKLGSIGPDCVIPSSSSSNGPPVVAYSLANKRWAVFWRARVFNRLLGTWVAAIQGQIFSWASEGAPTFDLRAPVTAVSEPLPDFYEAKDLLPEYSAAGSQTPTEYSPYQGVFEVAYVRRSLTGEVYSVKVYAGGALGSPTRLTTDTKDDRYVKLAVTRIDPVSSSLACTGAPGSRCALWLFEHFFGSTDHDITGYVTSSQY